MASRNREDREIELVSKVVIAWFRHYNVVPDDATSDRLATVAFHFLDKGFDTADELSLILICQYAGVAWTWANAPTSPSLH